jgi:predicted PurR-regulated permease PerM
MTQPTQGEQQRIALRILTASLVVGFMAALWMIVRPFWIPIIWAVILTSTTWPVYARFRQALPRPSYLAPLLASLILGAVLLILSIPLPVQLAIELKEFAAHLTTFDPAVIKGKVEALPLVGHALGEMIAGIVSDPQSLSSMIDPHRQAILALAAGFARGIVSTIALGFATLVGSFALYLYGESLTQELRSILARLGGENIARLLDTVHMTIRGSAYSVLATSLAQGALAGIGYYITGAPTPVLLGMITMVVSLIPFGPPFMYVPVSAYLLFMSGLPWYHGVGLAIWGIVVVSTIDNVLRPLFISQTTKLSTMLVLFGVLGGVASFGLLGVFIGPAIIAVAQRIWLELAQPPPAIRQHS